MKKVHKATVLKAVRELGKWEGYIAPSKVNRYAVNQGWCLGMKLHIQADKTTDGYKYYVFFGENDEPRQTCKLNDVLDEFEQYNCNSSLGYKVRFWQETQPAQNVV